MPLTPVKPSDIAYAFSAPAFVPATAFRTTQGSVVAGDFFRMDDSVAGIKAFTVGDFMLEPVLQEVDSAVTPYKENLDTGNYIVADVEIGYMVDLTASGADTPNIFFDHVKAQAAYENRIITVRWVVKIGSDGAPEKYNEAKFIIGARGNEVATEKLLMGTVTLKQAGPAAEFTVA